MKVGIIGYGWVGQAMSNLFPDAFIYSHGVAYDSEGNIRIGYSREDWDKNYKEQYKEKINECEITFICLPTPPIGEDRLDTSLVEESVSWCNSSVIVIRSTVNPGDCDNWKNKYQKDIVFQPEYLGETPAHPLLDPTTRQWLTFGGYKIIIRKVIDLYSTVYNAHTNIRQMSLFEAEIVKLSENRAIAFKVAQCQELYDVCEKAGVDYYTIRDAVYGDDPRFNLWWSFIYPEKRGMNSKCIPKDVYAWCAFAESLGYPPVITRTILAKNKEWMEIK